MTTSSPPERIAVVGTGLIGTSAALASARVGCRVTIWDADPSALARSALRGELVAAASFERCVEDAHLVIIATPIPTIPSLVVQALAAAPQAVVTDVASIKSHIVAEIVASADPAALSRWIPGHPMGGSERSGPDHASASVVDGIVWVLTPIDGSAPERIELLERWIELIGARPMRMTPERHDRLVAFVSHLPQVASTALMGLAATEEAGEPEILLLAAGGFRDLTRLASSNPTLWSDILLANREALAEAIDLYVAKLEVLRDDVLEGREELVRSTFAEAKQARLRLAAKPTVRAGVAVLQVIVPDRPGALAELTSVLGTGAVNIEDLQIVHSAEGGRGTVHLTVAAVDVEAASLVLAGHDFDPTRLA